MKMSEIKVGAVYAYTDHPFQRRTREHVIPVLVLGKRFGGVVRVQFSNGDRRAVYRRGIQHTWVEELAFRSELRA